VTPSQQHRRWRSDVRALVLWVHKHYPDLECITYVDHPWPGWDGRSFDVWDDAETWTPARRGQLLAVRADLFTRPWGPKIRHTILGHNLWTSFGGWSRWEPDDHSGVRRHLHMTYW
jgi:hypothetical protein